MLGVYNPTGPIALIEDGDIITIDIPNRKLEVNVTDEEFARRKETWNPPAPRMNFGWLKRYQKMVTSGSQGAVLKA